ncbi:hypothetical protein P154DRAFT_539767 [Amniculicola lignicola CBS 123094]|uniref:F-box domain-containing protein n=1 Tax=Amniculicola lignicola CBS 123094 TaxID=1392246 RepID=A0A6A5VZ18_9PLEO|nr:hypothetical protein P154DRAFT_539767 [Amniculicola lignicola CBS 123094]
MSTCGFLTLPGEIRNHIYFFLSPPMGPLSTIGFLCTSKQIRQEAKPKILHHRLQHISMLEMEYSRILSAPVTTPKPTTVQEYSTHGFVVKMYVDRKNPNPDLMPNHRRLFDVVTILFNYCVCESRRGQDWTRVATAHSPKLTARTLIFDFSCVPRYPAAVVERMDQYSQRLEGLCAGLDTLVQGSTKIRDLQLGW